MTCDNSLNVFLLLTEHFLWARQLAETATDVTLFNFHSTAVGFHYLHHLCQLYPGDQLVLNLMPTGSLEKLPRFLTRPPQAHGAIASLVQGFSNCVPQTTRVQCSITEAEQTEQVRGESKGRFYASLFSL